MSIAAAAKRTRATTRAMRKSRARARRDIEDGAPRSGARRGANGTNSYFGLTVDACY
jgi:hypothetical protein